MFSAAQKPQNDSVHTDILAVFKENTDQLAHRAGANVPWWYSYTPPDSSRHLQGICSAVAAAAFFIIFFAEPRDTLGREGIQLY